MRAYEFYYGSRVLTSLLDCISKWSYFKDELFQDVIDEIEANLSLVNKAIEQALLEEVRRKPDMKLPVSEISQ